MTLMAAVVLAGVARADEPEPVKPPKTDPMLKTEPTPVAQPAPPCGTCANGCGTTCHRHCDLRAWLTYCSATGKCGCCCSGYRQPSIYDYFACFPCRECAKYDCPTCPSCKSCNSCWHPFWATGHRILPLPTGHGVLNCQ
jgi:hypothetical protein